MKKLVVGILAHVDAGKTTLSEAMLYLSGSIRKLGRVDDKDAFLDTYEMERARGITIFSKQANLQFGESQVTLLDTPGHVDFSAEMERTLQVLDYAVLVVSGADGIQGHTLTLWRLLAQYDVPVFLFVNKMDQLGTDREKIMSELKHRLGSGCVDFQLDDDMRLEEIAVCEDELLEQYLETGDVSEADTIRLIAERKLFPCYFGSALKLEGVEELMQGIGHYSKPQDCADEFGGKVYKISRDESGTRLTHMKVTGGSLKVKAVLTDGQEKVNQIRIYSGAKYEAVQEVAAGTVCAVTGLTKTYPGQGLGVESQSRMPVLEPVLTYQIQLPEECDASQMLPKLQQLEEEEPQLHITWDEEHGEILAQLMGEVQIEILKSLISERFGVDVEFGEGSIVYKETIKNTVEGVGHFEPLRHYAEVHLLMEPGLPGSGLEFAADCSEDVLDRNWQRLILTHLEEKEHRGVLTGSTITDMKITVVAGRAHIKHTEGGDFRQSTYRAIRQGLMEAESVLLEPYYDFCLEVPTEMVGRALTDLDQMHGKFDPPEIEGEFSVLKGQVAVAQMRGYQKDVVAYTRGRGRLNCTLAGYQSCQDAEHIIEEIGYDAESDLDNPTGSVFCTHGAGFVVPWYEVKSYMHVESGVKIPGQGVDDGLSEEELLELAARKAEHLRTAVQHADGNASASSGAAFSYVKMDKELEEIFNRTYSSKKETSSNAWGKRPERPKRLFDSAAGGGSVRSVKKEEPLKEYLLVDGYNVIFAWEELHELAQVSMDAARNRLMDILCNYQGYMSCTIILVFDAYKVEGQVEEFLTYHNIFVVYTKEAETADQYIEKAAHEMSKKYKVTVATSDGVEQVIIRGQGALLMSSRELKEEVERVNLLIREEFEGNSGKPGGRNYLFDHMEGHLREYMEEVRLGKAKI